MAKPFLYGPDLTTEIKKILAEDGSRSAVAFWGNGCEDWVKGHNAKIIANLRMGGTNPFALQKVRASIKRCDNLHAKVYIGAKQAVVASANASINGLALEGAEVSSWIEAGIITNELGPIIKWFDDLWNRSSENIMPLDWKKAKQAWELRKLAKPMLPTFAHFDPNGPNLPLLSWTAGSWTVNENELQTQLGTSDSAACERVDGGIGVSEHADERILSNRSILIWAQGSRPGTISGKPWFIQTSGIVIRGGVTYDTTGLAGDVILAPEIPTPRLFDPNEKRFVAAFRRVISRSGYRAFHEDEESGRPWYTEREQLLRPFWIDVKAEYDAAG